MDEEQWLAERFEEHRGHLRAVAYRMLGSLTEADDAVQDTWLRLSRSGGDQVQDLRGWLTTVVARVCLNMLRARNVRREEVLGVRVPDPLVSTDAELQPEQEALLADSVGLALLVVLDTLSPAERLAFVLHDMFDLPFEDIAGLAGPDPGGGPAARQPGPAPGQGRRGTGPGPRPGPPARGGRRLLRRRARRRLRRPGRGARPPGGPARRHGRRAARGRPIGPRGRGGRPAGADRPGPGDLPAGLHLHPALVNGAAGVIVTMRGRPVTVVGFTVAGGRIVEIDAIADAERVRRITAAALGDG